MRRPLAWCVGACLVLAPLTTFVAAAADEISPACLDYTQGSILVDGYVNQPVSLTVAQLAELPGQKSMDISFVDRLGNTQKHSESGPLLWSVIQAAGGIHTPPPRLEQYQGPNPWITLFVVMIATNGYQSLVSEAEIDPAYGNQPVLLSLAEDGKPMTLAPYSTTTKAPAQLVVPADYKGGRYANRICRVVVLNGAVGPDTNPPRRVL